MSILYSNITLLCFFQQDYQICDPGPMVETGCSDGDQHAAVKGISGNLELARQLDFDSESLPFSDQQGETDSSHLHGNSAGEIQISMDESSSDGRYSGCSGQDDDESASKDLSQVIGSSCPTPTTRYKVRPLPWHGARLDPTHCDCNNPSIEHMHTTALEVTNYPYQAGPLSFDTCNFPYR